MFGLLGGLIGRAATGAMFRRPMGGGMFRGGMLRGGGLLRGNSGGGLFQGGVLRGLLDRRGGQQAMSAGGVAPAGQPQSQAVAAQSQGQQPQPAQPAQPAAEVTGEQAQAVVPLGGDPALQPAAAPQGAPPTATAGLLDEAPSAAPPPEPQDGEGVADVRQVANQTEVLNPVAPQEDMMFGAVPQLEQSGLEGLLDESPQRRQFAMEDPNPTKPVDTKSQARHGQAGPQYSYQTAGSWTAATPSYSFKRV